MTLNAVRVRTYLKDFSFEPLFVEELGWDRHSASLELKINDKQYPLHGVAEKRGVQVFVCQAATVGEMPDFKTQRKIETQLRRAAREHLVIYTDATKSKQIWKPVDWRGHEFYPNHQSGDSLIEKLQAIHIPLDEEESLDLLGTVHKLRDAFDRDRLTKRFYDHFQKEHRAFLKFIKGIREQGEREWYASLMLNRLMFIYFIQKKGFLDGDIDYLRNRLQAVQSRKGKGKFQTFYHYFLLTLFHQGFATQPEQRKLDAELQDLLGDVPYLNGGLFDVHELENHNPKIDIPDEAFERIFDFFDKYEWTLDTRPLQDDHEINPDVLGYIFEKYINQKQMGAYYTKEDITDYISRNTIIPYLFDEARQKCAVAFQPDSALWRLLQETPDRYIYPAVRKGVIDDSGEVVSTPPEVEKGIDDVSQRGDWNRPASGEYALPTETWREYVARRKHCLEVRRILVGGDISCINDLITYNLDIRRFAEDAILSSEGPELLRAFYQAISGISILDPTCGSGAFLFAALNILEPLYEACLDRMQTFVEELDRDSPHPKPGKKAGAKAKRTSPEKFKDFRAVLKDVAKHPNTPYFILKSIIVRNLYGVDIMEEAVEICKLRLFLKLVSQVDNVRKLEPLPDIDFNIRPGNTLVGFATLEDVKRSLQKPHSKTERIGTLKGFDEHDEVAHIQEEAEIVDRAFQKFHEMQTTFGMNASEFAAHKQELRDRLDALSEQLDRYLAGEYGIAPDKSKKFQDWRNSHQPFHWFAEFFGIMRSGGFDVIIGNPPYVEYHKVRAIYTVRDYLTLSCGNLYVYVFERSHRLVGHNGRLGLIVPLSLLCTERMGAARAVILNRSSWLPAFDMRPSSLFEGVSQRLCIAIQGATSSDKHTSLTGGYRRWSSAERPHLLALTQFVESNWNISDQPVMKVLWSLEKTISHKISGPRCEKLVNEKANPIYIHRICRYFIKALNFVPHFRNADGMLGRSDDYKPFCIENSHRDHALCLLNSSLFYWFWRCSGDGFHCGYGDVFRMPFVTAKETTQVTQYSELASTLMKSLTANSTRKEISTRRGKIEYQEFYPASSKPVTDEIDKLLGQHYSFTDEELDFIINYDIKYRMGQNNEEDE